MNNEKLKWCIKKHHGIDIVEPNKDLAEGFVQKAEHSLEEIGNAKHIEWKVSAAYYAMYNALYALLQRVGIKSEIHSCTFECINAYFSEDFPEEEIEFMKDSLEARNDTQYYVNKEVRNEFIDEMIGKAPETVALCKRILGKITESKINGIQKSLEVLK